MSVSGQSDFLDGLLREQRSLTAVDRFAQKHAADEIPSMQSHYRDLIPFAAPGKGEQYAFEVDLDVCSGCKACVSACHSLNGLDDGESWRDIGRLEASGTDGMLAQQTVTSACHHCVEPACADGCPTLAYHKDETTGIVKHLDDQCIGCRYCELTCPYEVPKFNERLGIVRKCDMCQDRLAEGEAPACVQACPNEAIKIRVVEKSGIKSEGQILPGTAPSFISQPTTQFVNLRAAILKDEAELGEPVQLHGHFPLAWMLAFTQAGAGVIASQVFGESLLVMIAGAVLIFSGLIGSVFHLGQPFKAWKAVLGWKQSWLSREILVFGAWSNAVLGLIGLQVLGWGNLLVTSGVALLGFIGVFTSVMVYAKTRRPFWSLPLTAFRFYGLSLTAGLLFCGDYSWLAAFPLVGLLAFDLSVLLGVWKRFRKSGSIMRHQSRAVTAVRLVCGLIALGLVGFPWLSLVALLVSEVAARTLFFQAGDRFTMPGVKH